MLRSVVNLLKPVNNLLKRPLGWTGVSRYLELVSSIPFLSFLSYFPSPSLVPTIVTLSGDRRSSLLPTTVARYKHHRNIESNNTIILIRSTTPTPDLER